MRPRSFSSLKTSAQVCSLSVFAVHRPRCCRYPAPRTAALPFRPFGDDVFFQVLRLDGRTCRLYAVDPGWLDPARRWVRVRIQQEGRFAVKDLLTGGDIPVHAGEFEFEVPAGSLRILEASRP